ncbi:MAG: hypothetical protein GY937_15340, partial [bacterium]|nr:hypothetical protein [bacterium]
RMKQEEKRLRQEIRELMERAGKTDAMEDQRYGKGQRGSELPKELSNCEQRLATIQAAKKRLEARQREEDEKNGREPGDQDRTGKPGKPSVNTSKPAIRERLKSGHREPPKTGVV